MYPFFSQFPLPLRLPLNLTSLLQIYDIFANVEVILSCHKKLLTYFEERLQEWDSKPELGDIFLGYTGFIKLYKHYVNNYDKSVKTLRSCCDKNTQFQTFCKVSRTSTFRLHTYVSYTLGPELFWKTERIKRGGFFNSSSATHSPLRVTYSRLTQIHHSGSPRLRQLDVSISYKFSSIK